MNIVWFKKDLRSEDHGALAEALTKGRTVGLFVVETEWLSSAEFDLCHLRFAFECLAELRQSLAKKGIPLLIRHGSVINVLNELNKTCKISGVFSHQETGLEWSFKRDIAVEHWARANNIPWIQVKQFAVIRKLKNRDSWNKRRIEIIERPLIQVRGQPAISCPWNLGELPLDLLQGYTGKPLAQKGGRTYAVSLLNTFLSERAQDYAYSLSSPVKAYDGCSRLSPHITWGTLSLSEINQQLKLRQKSLSREKSSRRWQVSLQQFESRLWWHCHFIQKLESEPEIEFKNFNTQFDGLRENAFDKAKF